LLASLRNQTKVLDGDGVGSARLEAISNESSFSYIRYDYESGSRVLNGSARTVDRRSITPVHYAVNARGGYTLAKQRTRQGKGRHPAKQADQNVTA
jgi:hypothetical protein